jgi:hypothetical protein
MTDPEIAELKRKVDQAEKRLREINQCKANYEKAIAALNEFYARGPHPKKKSGRPGFWKGPHGCDFVLRVETIKKERKCKTATAIRAAKKEFIRWGQMAKAYDKSAVLRAARLAMLTDDAALQSRYQEARKYWLFVVDPETYEKEEQSLKRNVDEALSAWRKSLTRNPYEQLALALRGAA